MSNNNAVPTEFSLSGRLAIVTGGSRGIGRGIAIYLSSLGANIVVGYVSNSSQADSVVTQINSSGGRAVAVQGDVSQPGDVVALFDRAESKFGVPAHILVACAGVLDSKYPSLAECTVEDWDRTFNVNAKGSFLCCKEAANRLARGGGGRIITVSSSVVAPSLPKFAAYSPSKAAIESMTQILAKELKGTAITANCIAPGPVATELFFAGKTEEFIEVARNVNAFGRLGEPQNIAKLVGFLCSEAGEWVNGQVIRVNGGFLI